MANAPFFPQLDTNAYEILGAAAVVALIINLIPFLSYPFYLFFTMIHELGHVFMTRFSGGNVLGFWVFSDATGVAHRKEGDSWLIVPAGYLGVPLFSASLILLSGFPDSAPYTLGILGGILVLFIVLYGKQSRFEDSENTPVTLIVGLGFSVAFIGIAWMAALIWSIFLLFLLGIQGALASIVTLQDLVGQVRLNMKDIDPNKMSQLAGCSPMFWTRVWSLLSLLILVGAIWFTWLRGLVV